MSEQVNAVLEEAKTALETVSETDIVEKLEKDTKSKVKSDSKKSVEKDITKKSDTQEVESKSPPTKKKRGDVPNYKVSEWVLDSRKRLNCNPEVAVIAFRLAKKADNDKLNILEARKIVSTFLKKEVT